MRDWPRDRAEIATLAHRYAASADRGDPDGVLELFVTEAVLVLPDPPTRLDPVRECRGRVEIMAALDDLRGLTTMHAIVGAVIEPGDDPDSASGRIACIAHHVSRTDDGARDAVWHLHYQDQYAATPEGWRIRRRELHLDFVTSERVLLA